MVILIFNPVKNFDAFFVNLLDYHVPLKNKILRANKATHMIKKLRKAIMKRSLFEKIHSNFLTEKSLKA